MPFDLTHTHTHTNPGTDSMSRSTFCFRTQINTCNHDNLYIVHSFAHFFRSSIRIFLVGAGVPHNSCWVIVTFITAVRRHMIFARFTTSHSLADHRCQKKFIYSFVSWYASFFSHSLFAPPKGISVCVWFNPSFFSSRYSLDCYQKLSMGFAIKYIYICLALIWFAVIHNVNIIISKWFRNKAK